MQINTPAKIGGFISTNNSSIDATGIPISVALDFYLLDRDTSGA